MSRANNIIEKASEEDKDKVDSFGFKIKKDNKHEFQKQAMKFKSEVEKITGWHNGTDETDSTSDLIRIEWKGVQTLDTLKMAKLAKLKAMHMLIMHAKGVQATSQK